MTAKLLTREAVEQARIAFAREDSIRGIPNFAILNCSNNDVVWGNYFIPAHACVPYRVEQVTARVSAFPLRGEPLSY